MALLKALLEAGTLPKNCSNTFKNSFFALKSASGYSKAMSNKAFEKKKQIFESFSYRDPQKMLNI